MHPVGLWGVSVKYSWYPSLVASGQTGASAVSVPRVTATKCSCRGLEGHEAAPIEATMGASGSSAQISLVGSGLWNEQGRPAGSFSNPVDPTTDVSLADQTDFETALSGEFQQ